MKFFKKLKSSNFWVSMISAVILILQAVFNVDIKTEYLNQIILGILGLLVMTGIVTDTPSGEVTVNQSIDTEAMKESVVTMFKQITSTLELDVSKIVSKLENVSVTQNSLNEKLEDKIVGDIVNVNDNNEVVKNEITDNTETSIIEQNQVEIINQNPQENNAPKNEL